MLRHSSYTYAEVEQRLKLQGWTQTAANWIGAHVRTFGFFGGSPAAVVPDNLKSGVTKPVRYGVWPIAD